jgi:hypothetical protein
VTRVRPDSLDWDAAAGALAGKRLNSMPAAELTAHWAQACAISRLTPLEEPPMDLPAVSLAAPPVPTPATRKARKPFKLHKVRQPRDPGQRS